MNGISVADGRGKDVIMNFQFDGFGNDNKTFYTDSNGLEMQKRILDFRPMWNYSGDQNISSNYYPVGSAIAIRNKEMARQATVMVERSTGGSAHLKAPGNIEIMHSRRLIKDDDRGVEEPLNETDSHGDG